MLVTALIFGGVATSLAATAPDAGQTQSATDGVTGVTQQTANTTVTFENQTSNGTVVTVSEVTLEDGGFVVIHDQSLLNGSVLDSVHGSSAYLEAGTHEDVTVTLDEPIDESQRLLALAYRDTDGNEEFDFVESQGQTDGAYTVENQIVADAGFVTVEEAAETTTTTEETTTEEEETTTTEETTVPAVDTTIETVTPTETATEVETITTEETTTTEEETTEEITTVEEETTTTEDTTTTEETTTTTEEPVTTEETTTEETTTTEEPATTIAEEPTTTEDEEPVDERTFRVPIDNVEVSNFALVVGEGEVDRTVVVDDEAVSDETVEVDVTELMRGDDPDGELDTVRVVFRNVSVETSVLVVTAPEGVVPQLASQIDLPVTTTQEPEETTTAEEPEETTAEAPEETTAVEAPEETTTVEEPEETTTAAPEETTAEEPGEAEGLQVTQLNVPETIVLNEGQLVVNAQVENVGDESATETVQLRIDGTVVATQQVEVGPGESTSVQFQLDRSELDVEPGETFVSVLTDNFGQVDSVEVTEQDQEPEETTTTEEFEETTTESPEDEPEETVQEPEVTTEAPAETTEEPDETTTEAAADESTSLRVTSLDAPESFALDDETLTVTAEVENPNDEAVTERVEFRVNGTVVATQTVDVEAGETAQVEFEVDASDLDLEAGEVVLEVLTRDFGQSVTVSAEE